MRLVAVVVTVVAFATVVLCAGAAGIARAASANPLTVLPLFVQKGTDAANAARTYREAGNITDANLMERIAGQPQAIWLTGGPSSLSWLTFTLGQARRQHQLPVYVVYDIPGRDCGSYSSGGAASPAAYQAWIRQVAAHFGSTPVAVIIEPDALPELSCWSSSEQAENYALIRYAAATLQARGNTTVYLDAGNPSWQPVRTIVARLRRAGVGLVRGFALNTAEFETTARSLAYGTRISRALGGKHFVIDTGRNGQGPPVRSGSTWWCNPPGRGIGLDPTTQTASPLADAYLWVKPPGYSDGPCNGGPPSGQWWPALALSLAQNAEQPTS
jgi:endoglucanase